MTHSRHQAKKRLFPELPEDANLHQYVFTLANGTVTEDAHTAIEARKRGEMVVCTLRGPQAETARDRRRARRKQVSS